MKDEEAAKNVRKTSATAIILVFSVNMTSSLL